MLGHRRLTCSRIGTFYNAVKSDTNKQKVKEWAWAAFPEAYEDLLKLGQYEVSKSSGENENEDEDEHEFVHSKETDFNIGAVGRDVEP